MHTIVVGAGAAGAIIAARLSESGAHQVTLVDAGPDYPESAADIEKLPADLRNGRQNSMKRHDWHFKYRPVDHRLWGAWKMPFPRGRVVGGSSAVNTCIALRGQPFDFDEWADLGLPEWSFKRCLPAFKRLENDLDLQNEWHGNSGPIPVRRHTPDELVTWQAAFLEACAELGFPSCPDTNDPGTTGAGPHAMNKVDGERMGAGRCYLDARVRARENLRIMGDVTVHSVRFTNLRAQGIVASRHGRVFHLDADRVVLAGGAIGSPGILLRSGIGSAEDVSRVGVTQIASVPGVAAKLLDHPGIAVFFKPHQEGMSSVEHPLIQTVCRYTSEGSDCPNDMQLQPGSFVPFPGLPVAWTTLSACVGKPRGVGRIRFNSGHVQDAPILETALLEHADDVRMAQEAYRHIGRLARTRAISALARPILPSSSPWTADGAYRHAPTRMCGSGYHPSGTVPMGVDADPMAACNEHGAVRGVRGLFVCDASVMPTIPSSNTHFPTLMMGERFAEFLEERATT